MNFGIVLIACATYFFLVPNHFVTGGMTGLATMLGEYYNKAINVVVKASGYIPEKFMNKTISDFYLGNGVFYANEDVTINEELLLKAFDKFENVVTKERIAALRALHDAGCKTWVSIEPYPTPNFIEQDLNEILEAISFCDKIIFGRLNYNKKVSEYKDHKAYFNKLAGQVIAYCETNGKQYHIKDGTIT